MVTRTWKVYGNEGIGSVKVSMNHIYMIFQRAMMCVSLNL